MNAQNGTYLISTFKGGYGVFPKPKFLNVTGSNVQDLNLVMNKTKIPVFRKLPEGLIKVELVM